jgi:hypothetical protein
MKSFALVVGVVMILALSSGIALADCESDCDGPFQTCLNLCRQTTKEDTPEAASCADRCLHGVSGCVKRCREKEKTSENAGKFALCSASTGFELVAFNSAPAASCIEQGLTCILHGTPCCSPYECKGKFPNTSCQ